MGCSTDLVVKEVCVSTIIVIMILLNYITNHIYCQASNIQNSKFQQTNSSIKEVKYANVDRYKNLETTVSQTSTETSNITSTTTPVDDLLNTEPASAVEDYTTLSPILVRPHVINNDLFTSRKNSNSTTNNDHLDYSSNASFQKRTNQDLTKTGSYNNLLPKSNESTHPITARENYLLTNNNMNGNLFTHDSITTKEDSNLKNNVLSFSQQDNRFTDYSQVANVNKKDSDKWSAIQAGFYNQFMQALNMPPPKLNSNSVIDRSLNNNIGIDYLVIDRSDPTTASPLSNNVGNNNQVYKAPSANLFGVYENDRNKFSPTSGNSFLPIKVVTEKPLWMNHYSFIDDPQASNSAGKAFKNPIYAPIMDNSNQTNKIVSANTEGPAVITASGISRKNDLVEPPMRHQPKVPSRSGADKIDENSKSDLKKHRVPNTQAESNHNQQKKHSVTAKEARPILMPPYNYHNDHLHSSYRHKNHNDQQFRVQNNRNLNTNSSQTLTKTQTKTHVPQSTYPKKSIRDVSINGNNQMQKQKHLITKSDNHVSYGKERNIQHRPTKSFYHRPLGSNIVSKSIVSDGPRNQVKIPAPTGISPLKKNQLFKTVYTFPDSNTLDTFRNSHPQTRRGSKLNEEDEPFDGHNLRNRRIFHHLHHVDSPIVSNETDSIDISQLSDDHKRSFYYNYLPETDPRQSDMSDEFDFKTSDSLLHQTTGAYPYNFLYSNQNYEKYDGDLFDSTSASINSQQYNNPWFGDTTKLTLQDFETAWNDNNLTIPYSLSDVNSFYNVPPVNERYLTRPTSSIINHDSLFGDTPSSSGTHETSLMNSITAAASPPTAPPVKTSLSPLGNYQWALARMPDLDPIPLAATVPGYLIRLPNGQIVAAAMTNSVSIQGIQKSLLGKNFKLKSNSRHSNERSSFHQHSTASNYANNSPLSYAMDSTSIIPALSSSDPSLSQTILSKLLPRSSSHPINRNFQDNMQEGQDKDEVYSFLDENELNDHTTHGAHMDYNNLQSNNLDVGPSIDPTAFSSSMKSQGKIRLDTPSLDKFPYSANHLTPHDLSKMPNNLGYIGIPETEYSDTTNYMNSRNPNSILNSPGPHFPSSISTSPLPQQDFLPSFSPPSWSGGQRRIMPTLSLTDAFKVRDWVAPFTFRPIYLSKYYDDPQVNRKPAYLRDYVQIRDSEVDNNAIKQRDTRNILHGSNLINSHVPSHIVAYPTYDLIYSRPIPEPEQQTSYRKDNSFSSGVRKLTSLLTGGNSIMDRSGKDSKMIKRKEADANKTLRTGGNAFSSKQAANRILKNNNNNVTAIKGHSKYNHSPYGWPRIFKKVLL